MLSSTDHLFNVSARSLSFSFSFRRPYAICIVVAVGISIFISGFLCAVLASLCPTVDIIFKSPAPATRARARLCMFPLVSLLFFSPLLSSLLTPFLFLSLQRAHFPFFFFLSFLATRWNMRALASDARAPSSLLFDFPRVPSSLRTSSQGVSGGAAEGGGGERISSTAVRKIDERRYAGSTRAAQRRKESAMKKCKVSRARSGYRATSPKLRGALSKALAARFH